MHCAGSSASSSTRRSCNRPRAVDPAMNFVPDFQNFARAYDAGEASVAVTTLVADLETPVSAYLKLAPGRGGDMFLLASVGGGAPRRRYSLIRLRPHLLFSSSGGRAGVHPRPP